MKIMQVKVQVGNAESAAAEVLVLTHCDGEGLGKEDAALLDRALDGSLRKLVQSKEFEGKANEVLLYHTQGKVPAKRLVLVGLGKKNEVNTVVTTTIARGEFKGVEWEQGHPCAVIKNSIAQGSPVKARVGSQFEDIADRKVSVEETIWFALDTKQIVQYYRDITTEGKADFGFTSGNSGGPGASGPGGGPPPSGGRPGGGSGMKPDDFSHTKGGPTGLLQRGGGARPPSGGGAPRGGPAGLGAPGGPPPSGGPGGPGAPGGSQASPSFVRIRSQMIFTLEK